jgi:hypothetical protein
MPLSELSNDENIMEIIKQINPLLTLDVVKYSKSIEDIYDFGE